MSHEVQDFQLPPGGEARLVAALGQRDWHPLTGPPTSARVRLLDSFDWGAYLAGAVIEAAMGPVGILMVPP